MKYNLNTWMVVSEDVYSFLINDKQNYVLIKKTVSFVSVSFVFLLTQYFFIISKFYIYYAKWHTDTLVCLKHLL